MSIQNVLKRFDDLILSNPLWKLSLESKNKIKDFIQDEIQKSFDEVDPDKEDCFDECSKKCICGAVYWNQAIIKLRENINKFLQK